MIFRFCVALDIDGVQLERFAFPEGYIKIDGIWFNDLLIKLCFEREVSSIKIKRADVRIVLREIQPFLDELCIVSITFFEFEGGIEDFCCCEILCIARPGDISDIIFLTFIKINVQEKAFFVIGITDRIT